MLELGAAVDEEADRRSARAGSGRHRPTRNAGDAGRAAAAASRRRRGRRRRSPPSTSSEAGDPRRPPRAPRRAPPRRRSPGATTASAELGHDRDVAGLERVERGHAGLQDADPGDLAGGDARGRAGPLGRAVGEASRSAGPPREARPSAGRRGSGPPRRRRTAAPPGRDEVVEQPPELALEVDVAVGPADDRQPAVGREPRPDPAPRQVERDREPGDQRAERRARRSPGPDPAWRCRSVAPVDAAELDEEVAVGRRRRSRPSATQNGAAARRSGVPSAFVPVDAVRQERDAGGAVGRLSSGASRGRRRGPGTLIVPERQARRPCRSARPAPSHRTRPCRVADRRGRAPARTRSGGT